MQRSNYRQRRLRDAAKLLPFLGVLLWLIPVAWPDPGATGEDSVGSSGLVYIFLVWLLLIVAASLFNGRMRPLDEADEKGAPPGS